MAFSGVSAAELKASDVEQQILIDALAQFDEHVQANDVTIKEISDYSAVTRLSARRRTQATGAEVTFEVAAYLSAFGYTEPTKDSYNTAYNELVSSMNEYVSSGNYDETIQTMAADQEVELSATTVPGTLEIDDLEYDDDNDHHKHDDDDDRIGELTPGAFAG